MFLLLSLSLCASADVRSSGNAIAFKGRLQKMLTSDALAEDDATAKASAGEDAIVIDRSDYRWSKDTAPVVRLARPIRVKAGEMVAVIGKTGSGKSSLLSVALGETMAPVSTSAAPPLIRGTQAYVSQQAWIYNATVRENILFGKKYDEKRYNNAVRVSALGRDFGMMEAGDMTEIGEKGVNLSGTCTPPCAPARLRLRLRLQGFFHYVVGFERHSRRCWQDATHVLRTLVCPTKPLTFMITTATITTTNTTTTITTTTTTTTITTAATVHAPRR